MGVRSICEREQWDLQLVLACQSRLLCLVMLWQLGITPWSTRCNAMLQAHELEQKIDHAY